MNYIIGSLVFILAGTSAMYNYVKGTFISVLIALLIMFGSLYLVMKEFDNPKDIQTEEKMLKGEIQ